MTETNTTKLEPCPRCRSPFVEAHDESRSLEHPQTTFLCAVCQLNVPVPMHRAAAVAMWNAWKRTDGTEGMKEVAERQLAALGDGKPGQLERLVLALLGTGRVPGLPGAGAAGFDQIAAHYVGLARAIQAKMAKGIT